MICIGASHHDVGSVLLRQACLRQPGRSSEALGALRGDLSSTRIHCSSQKSGQTIRENEGHSRLANKHNIFEHTVVNEEGMACCTVSAKVLNVASYNLQVLNVPLPGPAAPMRHPRPLHLRKTHQLRLSAASIHCAVP